MDRAVFLWPSIRNDDKFHLMFLRARQYDSLKAALLMTQYFENKLELFGDELLPKRITLDHLSNLEIPLLQEGFNYVFQNIETRGREVQVSDITAYDFRDSKAFLRASWYSMVTAMEESEDIQRRGMVQVVRIYGEPRHTLAQFVEFLWNTTHIHQAWPFHVNCIHVCSDNPFSMPSNERRTPCNERMSEFGRTSIVVRRRKHSMKC